MPGRLSTGRLGCLLFRHFMGEACGVLLGRWEYINLLVRSLYFVFAKVSLSIQPQIKRSNLNPKSNTHTHKQIHLIYTITFHLHKHTKCVSHSPPPNVAILKRCTSLPVRYRATPIIRDITTTQAIIIITAVTAIALRIPLSRERLPAP